MYIWCFMPKPCENYLADFPISERRCIMKYRLSHRISDKTLTDWIDRLTHIHRASCLQPHVVFKVTTMVKVVPQYNLNYLRFGNPCDLSSENIQRALQHHEFQILKSNCTIYLFNVRKQRNLHFLLDQIQSRLFFLIIFSSEFFE